MVTKRLVSTHDHLLVKTQVSGCCVSVCGGDLGGVCVGGWRAFCWVCQQESEVINPNISITMLSSTRLVRTNSSVSV